MIIKPLIYSLIELIKNKKWLWYSFITSRLAVEMFKFKGLPTILFELFGNLLYSFNITYIYIIIIDQNVIYIDNYNNIEFFNQDLINITLKTCYYIK